MIEQDDILKFKELYLANFGFELDDEKALSKLTDLVNQLKAIYRPITIVQANEYVNENDVNGKIRPKSNS